jgi:dihydrofolate reductase
MRLALIVAMTPDRVIGRDGTLPWRLPADLRRFKRLTLGHAVIMGRRTFASIGKPLFGRDNIVLTRQRDFAAPGCRVAHSAEEALELARTAAGVFVIGGAEVYAAFLPQAERIYLTLVQAPLPGDTRFPALVPEEWREVERSEQPADAENPHACTFLVLERRQAPGS